MPFTQIGNVIEWNFTALSKFESQSVTMVVEVLNSAVDPITHDQFGATSDEVPAATYFGGPLVVIVTEVPTDQIYLPYLSYLTEED
jgi:hypothetical protein